MAVCAAAASPTTGRPEKDGRSSRRGKRGNGRFISSRRFDHWYLVSGRSFSLAAVLVQLVTHSHSSPSPSRPKNVPPSNIPHPNLPSSVSYRNPHPSTGDCSYRGQEPSASSRLHLERGFISRSNLPFRAYYSPVCKPVSRLNPRRRRRRRPLRFLGCCC